ncbi:hypothetical protein PGT21_035407 [Puccinia graminis f. sp. tritici]|uniref:DUF7872 domain-containing protein n=1 Tax=Puccinia graminis f. sp. tritici TaxID=56615 RepID=A0A5B0QR53_PUCGR|nr:hypothetical protein PGT21_035407 [Puccinia graminis f. sp. tritici]KAA1127521.1 hypothetical protein PGTUg99_037457 [Puccinia graminis f. sp. tritici]
MSRTRALFILFTLTQYVVEVIDASPTTNSQSNHRVNVTFEEDPKSLCEPRPLEPPLWSEMDMTFYLYNYPNGTELNLEQYAAQVGAVDFRCGIGKICNAGQLCETVFGRDWYALVAAQNWNNFVNVLYQATGDAFDTTADILPTMLVDLEKDPTRTPRHVTAWLSLASNWISSFPSSLFKSYGPIAGTIWSWGQLSWLGLVMTLYQLGAFGWVETLMIYGNGEDRFTRSSSISWVLGQAQHAVQGILANITHDVIQAGISTGKGLVSLNQDGIFLSEIPVVDRQTVQKEYERMLKLKTLVKVWREQNVFVIRGADPCTQEGPDGAFNDPNRLSYCGKDSIMMSIVRGDRNGDGFDPTIFRAPLVEAKYGFTTEYLTTSSWECQKKYGAFEFDPHVCRNMTSIHNLQMQDECSVNLPVCDCTRSDTQAALRQGTSITKACREVNGLPI